MALPLEQIVRNHLRGCGFACEYDVPDPRPDQLVTVRRTSTTGGTRFVGRAMLTVSTWTSTRGDGEHLCENAVRALVGLGDFESQGGLASADENITGCRRENGPYNMGKLEMENCWLWRATVSVDYNE